MSSVVLCRPKLYVTACWRCPIATIDATVLLCCAFTRCKRWDARELDAWGQRLNLDEAKDSFKDHSFPVENILTTLGACSIISKKAKTS